MVLTRTEAYLQASLKCDMHLATWRAEYNVQLSHTIVRHNTCVMIPGTEYNDMAHLMW